MTIRNFDALFEPKAIALVGASNEPGSVGAVVARNLIGGGFAGPIMMVNPHEDRIAGVAVHHSVEDLPHVPDLAVIATPAHTVPALIAQLAQRGCRAAVVISAGFSAPGLRAQMLAAAQPSLLRVVGPNCLGFLSPARGVNASFAHLQPDTGGIALLSQSGAVLAAMIDWAAARKVGFSHIVSLGDMSDVDFGDLLDFLALDPATKAILLYVETITHARKFMSAARIAARTKPVIVVKAGRSAAGARAAATHTGALAGADLVYDAAFRRAGMLRVDTLRDLFDASATLASGVRVHGDRLTIITNGGGAGVLATDALEAQGGRLAALSDAARAALDAAMPPTWSRANPIDIIGDARAERYASAIEIALRDNEQDAILVMNCPTGVADGAVSAQAVIDAAGKRAHVAFLSCWLGEATARDVRATLSAHRIPAYETPDELVRAFMQLVDYRANQTSLMQTPAASGEIGDPARASARAIVAAALADGRTLLTEPEAKAVLGAYNIPTVETLVAATPAEAATAGARLGAPLALKILSRDISHKSDVGGVRLNLAPAEIEAAAHEMAQTVAVKVPGARLDGFTVQRMIARPKATELIAGLSRDPTFGPVILFGQGGVSVEVVADRAMALPPLNSTLAHDVIARTRVARLLAGFRDTPPADMSAIARVLISLSDLAADIPEIVGVDINPLLADDTGAIALDARIEARAGAGAEGQGFAISPYPAALRQEVETRDGTRYALRPIRPEDEPALVEMAARSTPEDLRLRFFGPMRTLHHTLAARLTQIDYDREMAFVAERADTPGLLGVSRLVIEPTFKVGEYAVIVRSDLKGAGLGYQLMLAILAYARARGVERVNGDVLHENHAMLKMAQTLGAELHARLDDPRIVQAVFTLK